MYSNAFKKPTTNQNEIDMANQLIDSFVASVDWTKLSLLQDEFYREIEQRREIIENLQIYLKGIINKEITDIGINNPNENAETSEKTVSMHVERMVSDLVRKNIIQGIPAHSTDQTIYDNLFYNSLSPKDIYKLNGILKLLGENVRNDKGDLSSDWMKKLFSIIVDLKFRDKPINVATIQEESGFKFVLAE